MPDGLDDFLDSDSSNPGQGGGALRKQLEQVLAQNKALQEQLAKQQASERNRSVDGLFAKHGIPELARDFFPSDVEPTDEAATSFVEKYGQLWGATAAPAATPPAEQAATSAAQQFTSQASPAPLAPLTEEQYAAKFAEAQTKDEFLRMLAELTAGGA
jgi:predicted component of type VI protein secretion system